MFLFGGGARDDIASLIIVRPGAVLVCGVALFLLTRAHVAQHRFLLVFAGITILLAAAHLIPLPPGLWTMLPGREVVVETGRIAGVEDIWRPLTLTPTATWNALYSLAAPLAVLLLGIQLSREERFRLLPLLIALGLVSGLLGLLQVGGSSNGPLYFYRITNNGAAVGFFANRNHQAAYLACLFPMLAVYAAAGKTVESVRLRTLLTGAIGIVLVPLLLVTGSRAGLVVGFVGLLAAPLLYRPIGPARGAGPRRRMLVFAAVGGGVLALGAITALLARAEAIQRAILPQTTDEVRMQAWGPIADIAWRHLPFGSGAGSFETVFKVHEPDTFLRPTYLNHAHNDWLEVYMTFGAPGLMLLLVAAAAWFYATCRVWGPRASAGRDIGYARLGSVALFLIALASTVDYPVRVPSIACFVVVFAIWLHAGMGRKDEASEPPKSGGSSRPSHIGGQVAG